MSHAANDARVPRCTPSAQTASACGRARELAYAAKKASARTALMTNDERDAALVAAARALREAACEVLAANEEDVACARAAGAENALIDRLALDEERIEDMARSLAGFRAIPDPLGRVLERRTLANGLDLARVSVPLGVVAVIYEARPNVTADAFGACLKSGNAAVLRGGTAAARSCSAIARILAQAAEGSGAPRGCLCYLDDPDRAATDELLGMRGVIDVLVPRGGAGLIEHCVNAARVPVIETGTGNCHVYVHSSADLAKAQAIVVNSKCRRFGVCNAAETLLVDAQVALAFLPDALAALAARDVVIHADERARACAEGLGIAVVAASEDDWRREYLGPEIAVRVVDSVDEAIEHVNRYGTRHSESIVAEDQQAQTAFATRVDAAVVYTNAATAFTDGVQFGLGAEIGISTQKLHARGPFSATALTTTKYVVRGSGQVRS